MEFKHGYFVEISFEAILVHRAFTIRTGAGRPWGLQGVSDLEREGWIQIIVTTNPTVFFSSFFLPATSFSLAHKKPVTHSI